MKHQLSPLSRAAIWLCSLGIALLAGCASAPQKAIQKPIPYPPPPEKTRYYYEHTITGTGDIEAVSEASSLKALLTGVSSRNGIPFAKPFDVAVHKGRVFVSDSVRHAVFVLDFPAHKTFIIGQKGEASDLGKPLGLAVDASGKLYVVDATLKRVAIYDRNGDYLSAFGGKAILHRPSGIDVNRDGSRAFVVDTGGVGSEKHVIHVFDPRSGKLLYDIGKRGSKPGEFNLPRDVKLGPDGLLYVSDGGNFRVQVLTQDGKFVRTWGKPGTRYGQFSRPKGISVDPEGNVYVVDAAFGNFQIFNPQGQLLMFIGTRSERPGPAIFMLPAGIDIDEDGRMYVVDQYYHKLDIFRPAELPADKGYLVTGPEKPKGTEKATGPEKAPASEQEKKGG